MPGVLFLLSLIIITVKAFEIKEIVAGRKVAAQIGDELNLVCRTTGCASPIFIWSTLLDHPLGGTVSHQKDSSTLSMKVGFENENDYLCTALCGEEKKQRTVKIEIYSFSTDPMIQISSPLVLGKPATITCMVPNVYPSDRLEISLKKEGKSLVSKDFAQDPLTRSLQTKSVTFDFISTEEDIGRTITCIAELPIEEMAFEPKQREATQTLNVNYVPKSLDFSILPSASVQEGESVNLRCSADSNPGARFVIKKKSAEKNEVFENQNGLVHILKVTPDDAGEYECEAENEFGSIKITATLSVKYQPRNTTIAISSSTVKEGETVTMICSSYGNPPPSFSWKKQLGNGVSQLIGEGTYLTLEDIRADNEGRYECEAVNSAGKETKAVELIVQVFLPTTPATTAQPETTTDMVDFTTERLSSTTIDIVDVTTEEPAHTTTDAVDITTEKPSYTTNKQAQIEDKRTLLPKTTTFKNDEMNPTESIVIDGMLGSDYMIPVIIVASTLATAAGPIAAALIYACRRTKINGSYSPVTEV